MEITGLSRPAAGGTPAVSALACNRLKSNSGPLSHERNRHNPTNLDAG